MPSGGSSCSGADPGKSYRDRLFLDLLPSSTFAFAFALSLFAYKKESRVFDREAQRFWGGCIVFRLRFFTNTSSRELNQISAESSWELLV